LTRFLGLLLFRFDICDHGFQGLISHHLYTVFDIVNELHGVL
jgi:hypothetical protein